MINNASRFFPALLALTLTGCAQSNSIPPARQNANSAQSSDNAECFVQLFDGKDFTDDTVTVFGQGEFPRLKDLPGTDKNWNDEADSFKSGERTVATLWTEENFKGKMTTYPKGARKSAIEEPSSMQISCE